MRILKYVQQLCIDNFKRKGRAVNRKQVNRGGAILCMCWLYYYTLIIHTYMKFVKKDFMKVKDYFCC